MLDYDRIDISNGLMLIKQVYQKNTIFVTISILKILILNMKSIFVMVVII